MSVCNPICTRADVFMSARNVDHVWPMHPLSCPHPLAIRHQVILDAALGAPVFSQLVLGYLLQVEHRHLS